MVSFISACFEACHSDQQILYHLCVSRIDDHVQAMHEMEAVVWFPNQSKSNMLVSRAQSMKTLGSSGHQLHELETAHLQLSPHARGAHMPITWHVSARGANCFVCTV